MLTRGFYPRSALKNHKSMSCLHSSSTEGDVRDESACSPLCISQSEQQPTPSEIRFVNVQKIFVKLDIVIKMQLKYSELGNLNSHFLPKVCIETHKSMSCLHSSLTEGDVPDESACSSPCISQSEQQPTPSEIRFVWLSLFVKYQSSVTKKLNFLNFSLPKLNQLKKKPVTTQLHNCYVYQRWGD